MSRPAASKKPVAMCCVSIGYEHFLLPADKGMKLVELLQSAFHVEKEYANRGYVYLVGDQPGVELALVRASQIKQKPDDDQRLIGMG
jgi:hypothetical protein